MRATHQGSSATSNGTVACPGAFPYSTWMLSGVVVRGFMILLIVGLPLMAARNSRLEEHVEAIERARPALYLSAAVTLLLIAGLTAIVAVWQGLSASALGWTVQQPGTGLQAADALEHLLDLGEARLRLRLHRPELADGPVQFHRRKRPTVRNRCQRRHGSRGVPQLPS